MSIARINTMLLHTWYHFTHSLESWVDLFINSGINMLVFAFIALYLSAGKQNEVAQFMLMGMILWNVIWVGQYGITLGALWEIWSKSFTGLFMTPLTIEEFLLAQMVSSAIKSVAAMLFTALIGYVLYNFSIFQLGWMLVIYWVLLLIFAWLTGMFVLSLIIRFGTGVQALSWTLVFLVQPFGGVFYPLSVLPAFIQKVALLLPVSYVFEAARRQLTSGTVSWLDLGIASILDIFYFAVCFIFLRWTIKKAKEDGRFARLEG